MSPQPQDPVTAKSASPAFLVPAEAAELLRVDVKTVYRWAGDRRTGLPVTRIRGTLRFHRQSLMDWLLAGGQRGRRSRKQMISLVRSGTSTSSNGVCADACAEEPR